MCSFKNRTNLFCFYLLTIFSKEKKEFKKIMTFGTFSAILMYMPYVISVRFLIE